jgi:hypothetical protein
VTAGGWPVATSVEMEFRVPGELGVATAGRGVLQQSGSAGLRYQPARWTSGRPGSAGAGCRARLVGG